MDRKDLEKQNIENEIRAILSPFTSRAEAYFYWFEGKLFYDPSKDFPHMIIDPQKKKILIYDWFRHLAKPLAEKFGYSLAISYESSILSH